MPIPIGVFTTTSLVIKQRNVQVLRLAASSGGNWLQPNTLTLGSELLFWMPFLVDTGAEVRHTQ